MLDVFLCHARADREAAAAIAARLERGAEVKVWLEEGETVAAAWEGGTSSAAILLLLSPEAVPKQRTRAAWQSLLEHLERHASPPVGALLLRDCAYPRLLERKDFFRPEEFRSLQRWIVGLHPESPQSAFVPARQPWFQGRGEELQLLWESLVDQSGTVALVNAAPASGKTSLAQEFAGAACDQFRDVLWVDCGDRSPVFINGDLASQLGVSCESAVSEVVEAHRLLLVLDDVTATAPVLASRERHASVLITTRCGESSLPPHVQVLPLEPATAFAPSRPPTGRAAGLWQAMATCRHNGFPLELAVRVAGFDHEAAGIACQELVAGRWVDPIDAAGQRFRLSALSLRAAHPAAELLRRHAHTLDAAFADWRKRPQPCRAFVAELERGLRWPLRYDWALAVGLADHAFAFLKAEGRLREAAWVYEELRQAARECQDVQVADNCSWELSWIQDEGGQIRRPAVAGEQMAFDFS